MRLRALMCAGAVAALSACGSAQAQTPADLRDDALLEAVVQATEQKDAGRLLALMIEVRERGLLMFEAAAGVCESGVPKTGLLDNEILRGTVDWAYHMELWSRALDGKYCGCVYNLLSFKDFSERITGSAPADITSDDVELFRKFWLMRRETIEPNYKVFVADFCGN